MTLGFTGTQQGMTNAQWEAVRRLFFYTLNVTVLHHGCCVGADLQAHRLALEHSAYIVGHPPTDVKKCMLVDLKEFDEIRLAFGYMTRNYHIVREGVDGLVATPKEAREVLRSGTWSTIRRARKHPHVADHKPIWIVLPDGDVLEER